MLKVNIAGKQRSGDLHSGLPDPVVLIISPFRSSEQDGEGWTVGHGKDLTRILVTYSLLANECQAL